MLAPFTTLEEVTAAVPRIVAHGIGPLILEYVDMITMAAITANVGLDLGIPEPVREAALAYLVIVLENSHEDRLEEDVAVARRVARGARGHGGLRPAVPRRHPAHQRPGEGVLRGQGGRGRRHRGPRRAPGGHPAVHGGRGRGGRSEHGALITGCGHVGDGNVHLSVFQPDPGERTEVLRAVFRAGMDLGGAISGEHGIGTEKKKYFLELEDPVKVELMRAVKRAFDPHGILGPGNLLD